MKISIIRKRIFDLLDQYVFSIISLAGFGILFSQSFVFALILDKENFGQIFLVITLFSVFSYLSIFGLDNALFKFYYSDDFEDKRSLKKHIFIIWISQAVVLIILLAFVGFLVVKLNSSSQFFLESSSYLFLLISGVFSSFFSVFQQFFLAERNKTSYALFSLGIKLVLLLSNLVSILVFGPDLKYFIISYFVGVAFLLLLSFGFLGEFMLAPVERKKLIKIFHFSWPLTFNSLISISFTNGYRVLISAIIPFGQLAVYGMASQISTAYYIGISSLLLPYNSNAYSVLYKNERMRFLRAYISKCLTFGLYGIFVSMIIAGVIFKYLRQGEYFDGVFILPILLLGQFLFLLYSHEYILLSFFNKTKHITFSTLSGIIVILSTYWFFISIWGIVGAAFTILFGYLVQYLLAIKLRLRIVN